MCGAPEQGNDLSTEGIDTLVSSSDAAQVLRITGVPITPVAFADPPLAAMMSAVSRALARPPPATARMPYFASYV